MVSSVIDTVGYSGFRSHPVQLGTRGGNLLDAQLAELRLELTKGLGEIILVLRPQLAGLNLAARLRYSQLFELSGSNFRRDENKRKETKNVRAFVVGKGCWGVDP